MVCLNSVETIASKWNISLYGCGSAAHYSIEILHHMRDIKIDYCIDKKYELSSSHFHNIRSVGLSKYLELTKNNVKKIV
jgi:hypothetical protein